jgi:anti-anti-sigma regulatory factor
MTEPGSFTFQTATHPRLLIVLVKGYCTPALIQDLQTAMEPHLQQEKNQVILDFSACSIINSPGISSLLELLLIIREDFFGKVFFSGLSALLKEVFSFAGVDSLMTEQPSLPQAIEAASKES